MLHNLMQKINTIKLIAGEGVKDRFFLSCVLVPPETLYLASLLTGSFKFDAAQLSGMERKRERERERGRERERETDR